jgi:hypothetical protein
MSQDGPRAPRAAAILARVRAGSTPPDMEGNVELTKNAAKIGYGRFPHAIRAR